MYRQQVRTLAPARALDLPGFGETPLREDSLDYHTFVRSAAPDEPVALIGTSLGGRIALELALESPERVAALVLVAPGLGGHDWSDEVRAYGAEEEAALERGDLHAAVEATLKMWLAGPRRGLDAIDPELRALVADMQHKAYRLQRDRQLPLAQLDPPASRRLAEVRVPTLVLTGDEDVDDIHAIATKLAREIPRAERATLADTAHLPSLERPDDFDRVVLAFLRKYGV
jgi:3-oxoadipate enol-lactonase